MRRAIYWNSSLSIILVAALVAGSAADGYAATKHNDPKDNQYSARNLEKRFNAMVDDKRLPCYRRSDMPSVFLPGMRVPALVCEYGEQMDPRALPNGTSPASPSGPEAPLQVPAPATPPSAAPAPDTSQQPVCPPSAAKPENPDKPDSLGHFHV